MVVALEGAGDFAETQLKTTLEGLQCQSDYSSINEWNLEDSVVNTTDELGK